MEPVRPVVATLVAIVALGLAAGAPGSLPALTQKRATALLVGLSTPTAPWDFGEVDALERALGRRADLVAFYQGFGIHAFDTVAVDRIAARGAVPMVTWEPWDARLGLDQPAFALRRIAAGDYDAYARAWAEQAAAWDRPLMLRFAPEMNGDWRPWSIGVNGNTSADFVAAWRRLHDVFEAAGARKVQWVWAPNVSYPGSSPLRPLFPGDAYVDFAGVDGYNWGTSQRWSRWQSFEQVFGPTLRSLRKLTAKPVVISEVASAERGGSKARWVRNFFRGLKRHPEIVGFVWFNENKETDWRIQSSPRSVRAFASALARLR